MIKIRSVPIVGRERNKIEECRYDRKCPPEAMEHITNKVLAEAFIEEIPYPLIHHITDRITHEVEGINRVMVDVTPKSVGTIEFE